MAGASKTVGPMLVVMLMLVLDLSVGVSAIVPSEDDSNQHLNEENEDLIQVLDDEIPLLICGEEACPEKFLGIGFPPWDASAAANAFHVTTENTTFSAPSNAVEGAFIALEINYNGSHTIAWNTVFEFAASTAPTATSTDGKTDILVFRYNGAVWQEVGRTLNLSES